MSDRLMQQIVMLQAALERRERDIMELREEHYRGLRNQEKAIQQLNKVLSNQEETIQKRIDWHMRTIAAQDEQIVAQEETMRQQQETIVAREKIIAEQSRRIRIQELTIILEKQINAQQDAQITAYEQRIAARNQTIAEQAQTIAARDQTIAEQEQAIATRDQAIAGLNGELTGQKEAIDVLKGDAERKATETNQLVGQMNGEIVGLREDARRTEEQRVEDARRVAEDARRSEEQMAALREDARRTEEQRAEDARRAAEDARRSEAQLVAFREDTRRTEEQRAEDARRTAAQAEQRINQLTGEVTGLREDVHRFTAQADQTNQLVQEMAAFTRSIANGGQGSQLRINGRSAGPSWNYRSITPRFDGARSESFRRISYHSGVLEQEPQLPVTEVAPSQHSCSLASELNRFSVLHARSHSDSENQNSALPATSKADLLQCSNSSTTPSFNRSKNGDSSSSKSSHSANPEGSDGWRVVSYKKGKGKANSVNSEGSERSGSAPKYQRK